MPRPSHVRDAVRDRLCGGDRHLWSIEELQLALHAADVPADYSSVFRALVWLEENGGALKVDLGDGRARYEAPGGHHEHVRCDACGAVGAIPGCVVEGAVGEVEQATGFQVRSHRLVLTGLCPDCARKA